MARLKRGSAVLETARQRFAALDSFTPKPNFGPSLTLEQYAQEIEALSSNLDLYNSLLARADALQNDIARDEEQLREKNKRMLAATNALYGPDSNEYEAAGGTRDSERKRSNRKTPSAT